MKELLLFLICFILVLILYEAFIVIPMKSYKSGKTKKNVKKQKADPVEIRFLIFKYGLKIDKVNYNQLLRIVSCVSSFDIAFTVSIIAFVEKYGYIWQMICALVLVVPLFLISYWFVAKFYEKKGMIKDV